MFFRGIYEKFLLFTGKCLKSKNAILHVYGKFVVYILSYIFHIKHYNRDGIIDEIKIQVPDRIHDQNLIKKIKYSYFRYRCTAREYIVYDFEHKTPKEIKSYLKDIEKIVLITLINKQNDLKILNAKEKAYEVYKDYYNRDILFFGSKLNGHEYESFISFVKKHNEFICKPSNLSLGRGIKKYVIDESTNIKNIFEKIIKNPPVIIEEFMNNDESLAIFHKKSLNIVRIITFRMKTGEIKIYRAYLSLGQGEKEYANAASGAIAVPIDINTGITYGIGVTEGLTQYVVHPDSKILLENYQIKKWDELLKLVYRLADVMPDLKYVGWDMALTPNGWVVVEGNGNAGQMLYQVMAKRSIKEEFMEYYMRT